MKDKIFIFDTTLRDGEQVPGCQLNTVEKIEVAKALEALGVDIIEAGFPVSSPGDFNSVVEIAKTVKESIICPLSRAVLKDIDVAAASIEKAKRKRIHTFISSSDIHIHYQFRSTREKILEQGIAAIKHAKKYVEDIEFSAMDAGRTENEFLAHFIEEAIKAGATTVNIPDTTGYCMPDEFGAKIKYLFEHVSNITRATVSVHCHNDLGLATANSLAGIQNGARQVEVTINGIGERAGNTALEEVVMAIKTHSKKLMVQTTIDSKKIYSTSRLVSRLMRMPVQANKAIVGKNAFAHSAGIHQHGILRNRQSYEIMNPQDIGIPKKELELTARSGRAALKHRLEKLGYELDQEKLNTIYEKFVKLADKKKEINDEDLSVLMGGAKVAHGIELVMMEVLSGDPLTPMAVVKLSVRGKEELATSEGNGPVDATFKAIHKLVPRKVTLEEYLVQAITGGSDDMGKVHVQLSHRNHLYYGFGADTDIIVASAKAYIDALNKIG